MRGGRLCPVEAELDDRNVGFGVHPPENTPCAVVEAALAVEADPRGRHMRRDLPGEGGRAARRIENLEERAGKAGEIVDRLRALRGRDEDSPRLPVCGEAEDRLRPGDPVALRGPFGAGWPLDKAEGKNLILVAGGIGMAPLRPLLLTLLHQREKFGDITLINGARTPELLSYGADRADWTQRDDLLYVETVDVPVEGWEGRTGFVPAVLEEEAPSAKNAVAVTCGPPIMIKFTLPVFEKLGFAPDAVVTTLERRMKCGIGICGRCNIGHKYVCVDGPVFTLAELNELPAEL